MSEIRRDEIIYEEGWRDNHADATPEPAEETEEKSPAPESREEQSRPLLTILQLVLCMAAALVLFLLKAMDSGAYHSFMRAYQEEMSKPVISQEVFDAIDWNSIFGGKQVTVTATPDELPAR